MEQQSSTDFRQPMTLLDLPTDVLVKIFTFLSYKEVKQISTICKKLFDATRCLNVCWKNVVCVSQYRILTRFLHNLTFHPYVRSVHIYVEKYDEPPLPIDTHSLNMEYEYFIEESLCSELMNEFNNPFTRLEGLKHLTFSLFEGDKKDCTELFDKVMLPKLLSTCDQLESVEIIRDFSIKNFSLRRRFSMSEIQSFSKLTKLTSLTLVGWIPELTPCYIKDLEILDFVALKELSITGGFMEHPIETYQFISKKMVNLEKFKYVGHKIFKAANLPAFVLVAENCKSLHTLIVNFRNKTMKRITSRENSELLTINDVEDFYQKIQTLHSERQFRRVSCSFSQFENHSLELRSN